MKRSTNIVTAVLVLVLGGSGAVYAFSKHNHWHMSPAEKAEFVTERVTRKLQLNSEQQQNFSSLAETVVQIIVDTKVAKKQHLDEVEQLLQSPSFNQARALELVQQKTDTINAKAPLVVSQLAIFLDSLNTDQKAQLQEFLQHKREHHKHAFGDH